MIKSIELNGVMISYEMQYKNVKNINLRIKSDGTVHVSANRFVSSTLIEAFLCSKSKLILMAIDKHSHKNVEEKVCYFSSHEICTIINELCKKIYPYFESKGVKYPELRFRYMVSQWGNCRPQKGILTFNKNLMYTPLECVEYVVAHEFTHFLHQNHSDKFYAELSKVLPDWRSRREILKKISLQ